MVAIAVLLTACSGTSSTTTSSSTATSGTSSAQGSGAPPTVEQTQWAGEVFTAAGGLETSIEGLASAATAGGGDVKSALATQFATIKTSAEKLATTISTVPKGSEDDPDLAAVKTSADQLKSSIGSLEQGVNGLQSASGIGAATALASVVARAGTALTSLKSTSQAIKTAAKDGKGTLGQAFAANDSCTSLTS